MEKNLKEIIANYSNTKDQNDNCYKGLFWDLETKTILYNKENPDLILII